MSPPSRPAAAPLPRAAPPPRPPTVRCAPAPAARHASASGAASPGSRRSWVALTRLGHGLQPPRPLFLGFVLDLDQCRDIGCGLLEGHDIAALQVVSLFLGHVLPPFPFVCDARPTASGRCTPLSRRT